MTQPIVGERRKTRRLTLQSGQAVIGSADQTPCQMVDISVAGAAVLVAAKIPEMSLVGLDLSLGPETEPTIKLQCQAAVVRSEPRPDGKFLLGLFFLDLSDETKAALDRFIKSHDSVTRDSTHDD